MVWLSQTAIPAVSPFARVPAHALDKAVRNLASEDGTLSGERLTEAFSGFENDQPALADWVAGALSRPLDDAARGLGVTLTLVIWKAFALGFGSGIRRVSREDCESTEELLRADEELRRSNPREPLESDDVIAAHQPEIALFVRERLDETMDEYADEIDIDDVDAVYRLVLVEVLVLSYAVKSPPNVHPPMGQGISQPS